MRQQVRGAASCCCISARPTARSVVTGRPYGCATSRGGCLTGRFQHCCWWWRSGASWLIDPGPAPSFLPCIAVVACPPPCVPSVLALRPCLLLRTLFLILSLPFTTTRHHCPSPPLPPPPRPFPCPAPRPQKTFDRARGFGFLEFRDPRDAEEAMHCMDKANFMGREISVSGGGWEGGRGVSLGVRACGRAGDSESESA